MAASENKFRYSASARELAVQIAAPFEASPDPGACVLPPEGGFAHLVWGRTNLPGILEIKQAYGETEGRFNDQQDAWQTTVRLTIEKCNLGDVVTIGRMSATLVSSYPATAGSPDFSVVNAVFEDVRLAGIPVQVLTNSEIQARPFTYENLIGGDAFRRVNVRKTLDGSEAAIVSIIESLRMERERPSGVYVDGNIIVFPGLGQVRMGELIVEPERCILRLLRAEFSGTIRAQADVGILSIDGVVERSMAREEPGEEHIEPTSTKLDEEEEAEVMEALKEWLNTEPEPDRPFLFFMGHSLTPVQFFREVEEKTRFGVSFLRFLSDQSKRFGEHPREAIRRATDANRAE